jgi:hypothetical protein
MYFATPADDGNIKSERKGNKEPSTIVGQWPELENIEFSTVNMALPHPTDANKAWLFSGDDCALISIDRALSFTPYRGRH